MKCLQCQKETKNPKFCSRSCAAKTNNRLFPKKEMVVKNCKICNLIISGTSKFCSKKCAYSTRKKRKNTNNCSKCDVYKTEINTCIVNGKFYSYCKTCASKEYVLRSTKFKQKCIEYKGGKCCYCGYNKCSKVLEFHHLDPLLKTFNISQVRSKAFNDKIKAELDKCILLCANCHRETHYGN